MCELFAMSCSRPADVTYSLNEFSLHGGSKYKNNSGWGIAYFQDKDALIIKEAEPASDSAWVEFIANQGVSSNCVIAHVRLATVGEPLLQNTHPFRHTLGRRMHAFAHNGTLHGLHDDHAIADLNHMPIGDTDSELAFCLLMERMKLLWNDGSIVPEKQARLDVFAEFASDMAGYGSSNFLYSDGDILFVHAHRRIFEEEGGFSDPRAPGLSIRNCIACQQGPEWSVEGCNIKMGKQKTLLFASVPLDEEGWEPLSEGTAIAVSDGVEIGRISTL